MRRIDVPNAFPPLQGKQFPGRLSARPFRIDNKKRPLNFFVYISPHIRLTAVIAPALLFSTGIQQQLIALFADSPAYAAPVRLGAMFHALFFSLRTDSHGTPIMGNYYRRENRRGDGPDWSSPFDQLHPFRIYRRNWRGNTGHVAH
ncbi:hypothetical protein [Sulfurimicrobium lacus]|uniref:hypothetical protein n=1 Tax=Sulfurimicrobium lacus TaxID=2715678 RepID=UPI001565FD36|nr:hypothetical protein [Sulfurimicrobium lacus]